jgi:hypothetical protein
MSSDILKSDVINVNSELIFDHYFLQVNLKNNVNIQNVTDNFKLDVIQDSDKTYQIDPKTGATRIIDKSFKSWVSKKDRKKELKNPIGFFKLELSENENTLLLSRPPSFIPDGCWCKQCGELKVHLKECKAPIDNNICFTVAGFINCLNVISINTDIINELIVKFYKNLKEFVSKPGNNVVGEIYKYLDVLNTGEFSSLIYDPSGGRLNIKLKDVMKTSKSKGFFRGSLMIYRIGNDGNRNSIRIYKDQITIVSYKPSKDEFKDPKSTFYYEVLERIGTDVSPVSFKINAFNSKVYIFSKKLESNKKYVLNLDQVYKYFYPTDSSGEPIEKEPRKVYIHNSADNLQRENSYIVGKGSTIYLYNISKPAKGKMSIFFYKSKFDQDKVFIGHHKVTAQIYNSGMIQLIFSYENKNYNITDDYAKQYININNLLLEIKDLLINHLKTLVQEFEQRGDFNGVISITDGPNESTKIFNTVDGMISYTKVSNVYPGFEVEEYDYNNDVWSGKIGYVVKTFNKKNELIVSFDKPFLVKLDLKKDIISQGQEKFILPIVKLEDGSKAYLVSRFNKDGKYYVITDISTKTLTDRDIRTNKKDIFGIEEKGVSQVSPAKEQPKPFSFYGECDKDEIVEFGGRISRKNNKIYPYCRKIKGNDINYVKNFIFKGFSRAEKDLYNIMPGKVINEPIEDVFSAVLKHDEIYTGSEVTFFDEDSGTWLTGIIRSRKKIGGGNDNGHVDYTIEVENIIDGVHSSTMYTVVGDNFHPKHRESRDFPGLNKIFNDDEEKIKEFLISCAEKLNIVKSTLGIQKIDDGLKRDINNYIKNLVDKKDIFDLVDVKGFYGSNIRDVITQSAFIACFVPENSIECFVILNNAGMFLITKDNIDESSINVVKLDAKFSRNLKDVIIYGHVKKYPTGYKFYPLDLIYNTNYLTEDYLYGSESISDSGRLISLYEILDLINIQGIEIIKDNKYIGPIDPEVSILSFVSDFINKEKNNYDIYFIPQKDMKTYFKYTSRYEQTQMVVKVFSKNKYSYTLGYIDSDTGNEVKIFDKPVLYNKDLEVGENVVIEFNLDDKFSLIKENPCKIIKKTVQEPLSAEKNMSLIEKILCHNDKDTFKNDEFWIIKYLAEYTSYTAPETSREPLVKLLDYVN